MCVFAPPGLFVGMPPADRCCCGEPLRHVVAEEEGCRVEGWQCMHCGRVWYTNIVVPNTGEPPCQSRK